MNDPSPVGSEFETAEQTEGYLRWLQAKVAASRADGRPVVEHDAAMKQLRAIIEAKALRKLNHPSRSRKMRSVPHR